MAYSEDLRKKAIDYLSEGNTLESAHRVFKIGLTTIKRWKKQYKETGSLAKKELHRSYKKLNPVKLSAYIEKHPDAYLREIGEAFGCTESAVRYALCKLKITRKKKTKVYGERNEEKRKEFIETLQTLHPEQIIYVDETGMDQFLYREYARAPRGKKVYGVISGKKYKRTSLVAGKSGNKIIAPLQYTGTTDHVLFEYWFEHLLLSAIPAESVIVMDNASFHRKEALRRLAHKANCSLLFLPPYSPDLNPIENFWAWLKRKLQDVLPYFGCFDDALSACFHLR